MWARVMELSLVKRKTPASEATATSPAAPLVLSASALAMPRATSVVEVEPGTALPAALRQTMLPW